MEAQKGYEQGSSLALAEGERGGSGGGAGEGGAAGEPGFTQAQVQKVSHAEAMIEERETEIRKVRRAAGAPPACCQGGVLNSPACAAAGRSCLPRRPEPRGST
jgi:hypothetical protein